jgi:hypothetical protein
MTVKADVLAINTKSFIPAAGSVSPFKKSFALL